MKRIALIMHGGVGPPGSDRIVPSIMGLVERLSLRFDVTVYTRLTPDGDARTYTCGRAFVKCVAARRDISGRMFVLLAVAQVVRDHRLSPFFLVHGLWGLPGGLAAVVAARLLGIGSVVTLLGGESASLPRIAYGNMRSPVTRRLTLWILRAAGAVTMLTHFQLDQLGRFGFTRSDGVHVIPFGCDPEQFPYTQREAHPGPFRILHVGNLNRVKDQRTLLLAFHLMCRRLDCHLRIVGEGVLDHELRYLVRTLGLAERVTFAGFVKHEELAPHFAWADLLMHAARHEGQGVVFAEAAASGLPVCGTEVGLLSDLGSSFAVNVRPGDHEALADAAVALLADPARRRSLSRSANTWAVVHTAPWTSAQFADLYDSLCAADDRPAIPAGRPIRTGAPA